MRFILVKVGYGNVSDTDWRDMPTDDKTELFARVKAYFNAPKCPKLHTLGYYLSIDPQPAPNEMVLCRTSDVEDAPTVVALHIGNHAIAADRRNLLGLPLLDDFIATFATDFQLPKLFMCFLPQVRQMPSSSKNSVRKNSSDHHFHPL